MLKKIFMKNKGITTISLVITIIVLLILAGVSIAMLTGENQIIYQAAKATLKTKFAGYKESVNLKLLDIEITGDKEEIPDLITNVSEYIPNLEEEYKDNIIIYKSKMVYIGEPTNELKQVLDELEIKYYAIDEVEEIEFAIKYKTLEENQKVGFDTKNPPEDGIWALNGIKLNFGNNTTYNQEKGYFEQVAGVGTSKYILTDPFVINYDKSFTIEYSFKMDNLETNVGDIQMMSIEGVNPKFEHILFYTYSYVPEKWFSMYSPVNGLLNGERNIEKGNTPSPLLLDDNLITLGLVYDKEEGLVKQYVNGVLNKEEPITGTLNGETLVTWSNTRQIGTNQNGIAGEVYKFALYEEKVSDEQMLYNHNLYTEEYSK